MTSVLSDLNWQCHPASTGELGLDLQINKLIECGEGELLSTKNGFMSKQSKSFAFPFPVGHRGAYYYAMTTIYSPASHPASQLAAIDDWDSLKKITNGPLHLL